MKPFVSWFGVWPFLGCLAVVLTGAPLAARTFTSQDGKSFDGEVVNATDETAVIERTLDRKRFTVPVGKLSAEDRAYVVQWRKDNPLLRLSFVVSKERESIKKEKLLKVDDECFKIVVRNDTAEATPPLVLYYSQFKSETDPARKGRSREIVETQSGKLELPAIPAFRTITVNSQTVRVSDITRETRRTERNPTNGQAIELVDYDKTSEDLAGIHFVVLFNKRQVAEWSTNGFGDRPVDFKAADGGTGKEGATKDGGKAP